MLTNMFLEGWRIEVRKGFFYLSGLTLDFRKVCSGQEEKETSSLSMATYNTKEIFHGGASREAQSEADESFHLPRYSLKTYILYMNIYISFTHKSQKLVTIQMSIKITTDHKVWHRHIIDYYTSTKRNEIVPHTIMWMSLTDNYWVKEARHKNTHNCVSQFIWIPKTSKANLRW